MQVTLAWTSQEMGLYVIHNNPIHQIMLCYTIDINGKTRKTGVSHTGVKQGCPIAPPLLGLGIDGMQRFLMSLGHVAVLVLSSGQDIILGYHAPH